MPARDFSFLHAADIHLDSPLRGLARRGDLGAAFVAASRQALENLVQAAIGRGVAFLVIAGDIYDGDWKDYATGQFFVRQMGLLAQNGIRVFLVRGNHDAESVVSRSLPLPSNVHSFSTRAAESVVLDEFGVALHGRGFAQRHVPENVALAYPAAVPGCLNIGVLHTSLTGREGHDVYAPCSVEDLASKNYDYWALGHIHQREIVARDPFIVFPGNLQGRHAGETGAKGATLVGVRDGTIAGIEAITLDAARFETAVIDIAGLADIPALMERAATAIRQAQTAAEGRPLALRITLTGRSALHDHVTLNREQIDQDVQALAFEAGSDILIEKLRIRTEPPPCEHVIATLTGFDSVLADVAGDPAFAAEIERTLRQLWTAAGEDVRKLAGITDPGTEAAAATQAAIQEAGDLVLAGLNGTEPMAEAGR
jgi:DNA repair protein SbcD/Mre11